MKDYGFKHLSGNILLAWFRRLAKSSLAGDLLRAEQNRPDSTYGAMIKEYITEGQIVPMEVTVKASLHTPLLYPLHAPIPSSRFISALWQGAKAEQLLENAMRDTFTSPPTSAPEGVWSSSKGRFLIDGFPRKMDQALRFDASVRLHFPSLLPCFAPFLPSTSLPLLLQSVRQHKADCLRCVSRLSYSSSQLPKRSCWVVC